MRKTQKYKDCSDIINKNEKLTYSILEEKD
jgi:hypothetical protein